MAVRPISTLVIGLGGSGAWTLVHVKKQILDAYNEIPGNIALVAMDTAKFSLSKIGDVALDPQEYAHLGGDARDMTERVARTNDFPHIKSWYLADWYLRSLPPGLFALDQGAGQFRQLGRLALFRDVHNVAQSAVQRVLDNKLRRVQAARLPSDPAMSVIIVGSLVGGTGAGFFLDIPHLVRRVAQRSNTPVNVRAFLFLPQAFQATLGAEEILDAKARAFAAMRELSRFIMHEDYKTGYPMFYHAEGVGVDDSLWRSSVQSKLYDYVYLIDGEGNTQTKSREFGYGSAPVVADAIMSYIDGNYGPYQEQYAANIQAKVTNIQDRIGKQAFVGAVGTYSVIMPMRQVMEAWTHDLGLEILKRVIPGSRFSEREYILDLDSNANPARETPPLAEVERIMTQNSEVPDPTDPDGNRRIAPTPLWRKAFQIYRGREEGEARLVRQLALYDLQEWREMIIPSAMATDQATRRVIAETNNILADEIKNHTLPSNQRKPAGRPEEDYEDIRRTGERFILKQLGQQESGGSHKGGEYGDALERFVEYQVDRFRNYTSAYIQRTLNGSDDRYPAQAKVGKLGWLLAVMKEWRDVFASVRQLLESMREGTIAEAANSQRTERMETLESTRRAMKEKAGERSLLGKSPAIQAQEGFLAAVQSYVDFYRTEFARNAVAKTTLRIREFLDSTIEELGLWADVLALDNKSLYSTVLNGGRNVRVLRNEAQRVENHLVINDAAWERRKYQQYIERGAGYETLLNAWSWEAAIVPNERGVPVLSVKARLGNSDFNKEKIGKWAENNLAILLGECQRVFAPAIERESVLGYLMTSDTYADNAAALGDLLASKSGYVLGLGIDASMFIPTNVLLAYHSQEDDQQSGYLRDVLWQLASKQGIDLGKADRIDSNLHRIMECSDPFRLTLLSSAERVALQGITEYERCRDPYMRLPWDARQRTHIFPAEVRAMEYEEKIVSLLRQSRRLISDRVRRLLEDDARVKEFLLLMAHNIIIEKDNPEQTTEIQHLWALEASPPNERDRDRTPIRLWWLSEPSNERPSLMEAMNTYVINGKDIRSLRPGTNLDDPIPYEHIRKYLERARQEDAADRIDADELALTTPRLREWLERAFMPPVDENGQEDLSNWTDEDETEFLEVATIISRHDILKELKGDMEHELPALQADLTAMSQRTLQGSTYDALQRLQEEYDLYSVAVIMLDNEMERLDEEVKRRYQQKTRTTSGGRSGINR